VEEYTIMMKILENDGTFRITDFKNYIADSVGPPATFGGVKVFEDGTKGPIETTLSGIHDLMTEQSIDYIFEFKRNDMHPNKGEDTKPEKSNKRLIDFGADEEIEERVENFKTSPSQITIDAKTMKVEQFLVEGKDFSTLSDHFGLSVSVNIDH
jgi:hypothetical protein